MTRLLIGLMLGFVLGVFLCDAMAEHPAEEQA